jgi:hypothetical protein
MELPLPLVLTFVFAIVIGYFFGRIASIRGRNDGRFD